MMELPMDTERIVRLRRDRAWSQEELARVSGLSVRTIQRVETGAGASLETRRALAAAFDLDPVDLDPVEPDPMEVDPPTAHEPLRPLSRGARWGLAFGAGFATLGFAAAVWSIASAKSAGEIPGGEAGMAMGVLSAVFGLTLGLMGWSTRFFRS